MALGNLFGWESFVFFQSGLPTAGVALAVNDGDDRDKIREDTIDDQIRKSPGQGHSGLTVHDWK
jgi:hypothetical protein